MFKKITQNVKDSNVTVSSRENNNLNNTFSPNLSKNIFSSREVESFGRVDVNSSRFSSNEFKNPPPKKNWNFGFLRFFVFSIFFCFG